MWGCVGCLESGEGSKAASQGPIQGWGHGRPMTDIWVQERKRNWLGGKCGGGCLSWLCGDWYGLLLHSGWKTKLLLHAKLCPTWVSPWAQIASLPSRQWQVMPPSNSWPPCRIQCLWCAWDAENGGQSQDLGVFREDCWRGLKVVCWAEAWPEIQGSVYTEHREGVGKAPLPPRAALSPWNGDSLFCILLPVSCLPFSFSLFWTG